MNTITLAKAIENAARAAPVGPDYRRAAVFVVFAVGDEPGLLLIRRADRGDPWSNHIAFPGGHVDPGDADALAAAYRETEEEIGLGRADLEYLADMGHFQTHSRRVDVHAFAGVWRGMDPLRINAAEVAEARTVRLAALLDQHQEHGYSDGRVESIGEGLVYTWADWRIWGVTARILHHLFGILEPLGGAALRLRA